MTASNQQSNKSSKRRQKRKQKARAAFTSKPHILLKRDQAGVVGDILASDGAEVVVDIPGYAASSRPPIVTKWLNASAAAVGAGAAFVAVYVSSAVNLLRSNG